MRILIAARYTLRQQPLGGVQSWIEAIRGPLEQLGHQVSTWGRKDPRPTRTFDLGILAHWCDTSHLAPLCRRMVSVSHGVIEPERPGPTDTVVFTSEEVRDHWGRKGPVLRQPIDLDFWAPAPAQRVYLTRFSYRGGLTFVPGIARGLGLRYRHIAKATPRDARNILRQSAVVLATGRAALEAMACGAPTLICDHRHPYQGPLFDSDTFGSMQRNYSGRGGYEPSPDDLLDAISGAMKKSSPRFHVEQHHDAREVAEELLQCCT